MSSILTSERLKQLLETYEVPAVYSHSATPIEPPYIAWLVPQTNNFDADNTVYQVLESFQIELYSRVNVLQEERELEKYLTENGILWDKVSETWIDEEKVMMTVYEL